MKTTFPKKPIRGEQLAREIAAAGLPLESAVPVLGIVGSVVDASDNIEIVFARDLTPAEAVQLGAIVAAHIKPKDRRPKADDVLDAELDAFLMPAPAMRMAVRRLLLEKLRINPQFLAAEGGPQGDEAVP